MRLTDWRTRISSPRPTHSAPVLFIVFNRPAETALAFNAIRTGRPSRLFIAADGPRPGRKGDVEACAQVRKIVSAIDWDCHVEHRYCDVNKGCREAVSEAVSWFFEHVPEGIILEDDCVAEPSFFPYCTELLARFRDDERIFKISGTNLLGTYDTPTSYFFSIFGNIWGWASWRRAWRHFDVEMTQWPEAKRTGLLERLIESKEDRAYYARNFERTYRGKIDTWDYQWAFARFAHHGLTVLPRTNLVQNVGFGRGATHTTDPNSPLAAVPSSELTFPLVHPEVVEHDVRFRRLTNAMEVAHTKQSLRRQLRQRAKRFAGRR
jgi:hypothetical protein